MKAVFLYNFARFVEWPDDRSAKSDKPLIIGVVGADPFGRILDDTVQNETVNGRPLLVVRFRSADDLQDCHILFISGSEGDRVEEILEALKGRQVLTVCDWEGISRHGTMVRFITDKGRVRLRINLDAIKNAGLTVSSKLLRSAELVSQ